ncbi:hypothetical protein [Niallia oryzisoli]
MSSKLPVIHGTFLTFRGKNYVKDGTFHSSNQLKCRFAEDGI